MVPSLDLPQVDLMNFRVEYVWLRSGLASERYWINKTKGFSERLRTPNCASIDNLKASDKAIYSAKLTRALKAVTYWDNTFLRHSWQEKKKLTHLSRFPTSTVKPNSYGDKTQNVLPSRSVGCPLSHLIVDAIADSFPRILLVPNVVLNS